MKTRSTLRTTGLRTPETITLVVRVRGYGSAYIARCNGRNASCTWSAEIAVRRAAHRAACVLQKMKVLKSVPHQDDLPLEKVNEHLFHIHLGPVHQFPVRKKKGAAR